MGLPGFRSIVNLIRQGAAGHEADGSPVVSMATVWTKNCYYQQQQGTDYQTQTGSVEYEVYRFWLPFLTGSSRPLMTDILESDGYRYEVIGIEQESLNHHIIVRAHRVER
jgi:hypothetical protein